MIRSSLNFRLAVLAALISVLLLPVCTLNPPPHLEPSPPRPLLKNIASPLFKIAVFNFADKTYSTGTLAKTIPDKLSAILKDANRFSVYRRSSLARVPTKNYTAYVEKLKNSHAADAVLKGTIVRFYQVTHQLTIDIEIILLQTGTVLFERRFSVTYAGLIDIHIKESEIRTIAKEIIASFPKVSPASVVNLVTEDTITINKGSQDGIEENMVVLIQPVGEQVLETSPGKSSAPVSTYTADGYISDVKMKMSNVILFRGNNQVSLRDKVIFK